MVQIRSQKQEEEYTCEAHGVTCIWYANQRNSKRHKDLSSLFAKFYEEFKFVAYGRPTVIVLHSYGRNFLSNPRRIHSGQKDKEKEEYGLL